MQNQTDPYLDIQNRITGQIGALAEALPHCALAQIVRGIDDIRCLARDNGFAAVETLASRLESAVAGGGYRAAILTLEPALKGLRHRDCRWRFFGKEGCAGRAGGPSKRRDADRKTSSSNPQGGPVLADCCVARRLRCYNIAPFSLLALGQNRLRHDASIPSGQALSRRDERRGAGPARTDAGRGARGLAGVGGDAARALTPNA